MYRFFWVTLYLSRSLTTVVIREYGRQGKGAPLWDLYLFVGRNIFRCILTDTGFHVADNDNQFEL